MVCSGLSQTDSVYYGAPDDLPKREKQKEKKDLIDKLNYGGSFQLFFGTTTFIYLAPTVGINATERLNVGVGAVYSYWNTRFNSKTYSQSVLGGQLYAKFKVIENLALVGQYDKLFQPDWNSLKPDSKIWVDYALVGFSYAQPAGDKTVFYTTLMYNLTPHRSSIYPSNFVFQFGFHVGF